MLKDANVKTGLALSSPDPDYIPYACHIAPETLLTKNGELMQTLKITGASQEQVGAKDEDLRTALRLALQKHIPDASYALWVHTIRRKRDMSLQQTSDNSLAQKVSAAWEKKHGWKSTYVNEIYLTIIKDSAPLKMNNIQSLLRSLSFKHLNEWHESYLSTVKKQLDSVVTNIQKELQRFSVKRLSLVSYNERFYSEPLQFLSKILNLSDQPVLLKPEGVSETLASYKVAFGFNVLEVVNNSGKRFASILTLKEYQELSIKDLDRFLQMPQEFIITQTLDFINSKQALNHFQQQAKVLEASQDQDFYEKSGLKEVIETGQGKQNAFGESQLTITLLNSDLQGLESDIEYAHKILSQLGMNATRRDLRMEECYWASLPANFSFATRRKPMNTNRFAGLISLSTEEFGAKRGNVWGEAITVFKTAARTPFYFNFHQGKSGHTAIMGPPKTGKRDMMHFLLAQARTQVANIVYLGCSEYVKPFSLLLGGQYHEVAAESGGDNPLALPATQENLSFFFKWLVLLSGKKANELQPDEKKLLQQAAKFLLKMPQEKRMLKALLPALKKTGNQALLDVFSAWSQQKEKAAWIAKSNINMQMSAIQGINVAKLCENPQILAPVLWTILHKIESSLNGEPTIIAVDEAWKILNHPQIMPEMAALLDRLAAKNALFLFSTENVSNENNSLIPAEVAQKIATKIFMPNKDTDKYSDSYQQIWQLSEAEYQMLLKMQAGRKQMMIKTPDNSIILDADLEGLNGFLNVK